jgi:hypothetical protein
MVSLIWIGVLNFGLACVMHGSRFMFELMTLHCKNVQKFLSREITTFCTGGQKKKTTLCNILFKANIGIWMIRIHRALKRASHKLKLALHCIIATL